MITRISRDELTAALDRGETLVIIDTLPKPAYRKGHLPGAINFPSDDIVDAAPRHLSNLDTPIVVYCANGPCKRSALAAERLQALGYRDVRDYHEGKADWVEAGLPLEHD